VTRCRFVLCRPDAAADEHDVADLPAATAEVRAHLTR